MPIFLGQSVELGGASWWNKKLIQKYRMVQNLPPFFFNPETEIDLCGYFDSGYFESEETEII
jgi:hypothetical protein